MSANRKAPGDSINVVVATLFDDLGILGLNLTVDFSTLNDEGETRYLVHLASVKHCISEVEHLVISIDPALLLALLDDGLADGESGAATDLLKVLDVSA